MPRKEKIINWAKVLKEWFTLSRNEKETYRDIASGYSRCAVGEQRMRHPKVVVYTKPTLNDFFEPQPVDSALHGLGYQFYEALNVAMDANSRDEEAGAIVEAVETLHEIKSRVKELEASAKGGTR